MEAVRVSRRVCEALGLLLVVALVAVAEEDQQECTVIRGDCRLVASLRNPDNPLIAFKAINVSCECKHGQDVTMDLERMPGAKCTWWIPSRASDPKVNSSTLHIVGCSVMAKPFPASVLDLLRRTNRLELFVRDSPTLRLSRYLEPESSLPELQATFINSNLSGIPEGVLGGVNLTKVRVEDCSVGVVESRAFSKYSREASVNVTFINTVITTLKMVAFELPPSSVVTMIGGSVLAWDRSGFEGGAQLELRNLRIGRLLGYAINLYGLHTFTMADCTVAELLAEALAYRTVRTPQYGKEVKNNSAVLTGNTIISASGEAFLNLCFVNDLVWSTNTFAYVTEGPFRLQSRECERERNWSKVVTRTDLNCSRCENFRNPDSQMCAIYETGLCITCEGRGSSCNSSAILSNLIHGPCGESHPDVAEALRTTCAIGSQRTPRRLRGGGAMLIPSALSVVIVVIVVALGYLIKV